MACAGAGPASARGKGPHPAWDLYRDLWAASPPLPDVATLNAWATARSLRRADGGALHFVAATGKRSSALDYERSVAAGTIPTRRDNLHDLCNALVWLVFPRTKAALNAVHLEIGSSPAAGRVGGRRGARRDAATLLDESGVVVLCADPGLVALWRARRWRALFHERADDIARAMTIAVIGHGVLAKLIAPYPALTAHALVIAPTAGTPARSARGGGSVRSPAEPGSPEAVDRSAAAWLAALGAELAPADLLPLPLAAWPGWDPAERGPERFDDTAVFRPLSRSSPRAFSGDRPAS